MEILVGLVVKLELIFFFTIGICFLLDRGNLLRDAIPIAIVLITALYSFAIQVCFLINAPVALLFVEVIFFLTGLTYFFKKINLNIIRFLALAKSLKNQSLDVWLLYLVLLYLAVLAFLIPEGNYDSMRYNIARVSLFMQEKSFFLNSFTEFHQVVFPVGGDILFFPSLRFGTDYGLAISSWLAFVAIITSSYAVARYFSSKLVAVTVMLIIASVPLLVFQATGTKPDIWSAAVASTSILLLIRLSKKIDILDLTLVLILIAFGLSAKFTFLGFALPFCLLLLILLVRRSQTVLLFQWMKNNLLTFISVLIVLVVLSQVWLMYHNYLYWDNVFGPDKFTFRHQHDDGLSGAVANLVRYLFQSVHLLTPTDILFEKLLGMRLTDWMHEFYYSYVYPIIGDQGIAVMRPDFSLKIRFRWGDSENGAWFGPLGFLIILPALIYGLFSKHKAIKAIAISLICYIAMICWNVSWMPWNGRFFSLVAAASSALVAVLLMKFAKNKFLLLTLRASALLILCYSAVFNQEKELLNARAVINMVSGESGLGQVFTENIWAQTNFGSQRQYYTEKYFGDSRVKDFSALVAKDARVGIVTRGSSWIYPFLAIRPDIHFIALTRFKQGNEFEFIKNNDVQYILCINTNCNNLKQQTRKIWPQGPPQGRHGALLELL